MSTRLGSAFERRLVAVAKAIAGVMSAVVAVMAPASVVLAGSWGTDPRLADADIGAGGARPVPIEPARDPATAALAGARAATLDQLHQLITARSRT